MKRFFFSILIMLLASCSSALNQPVTQTHVLPSTSLLSATPTLLLPSATSSPTETLTPLPSTLTPFPKLTSSEAKTVLFELLLNNGGCRLPCLLGYTPITSHQEMRNFFSQFRITNTPDISISKAGFGEGSSVIFFIHYLNTYLNIGISTYETKNQVEALGMGAFSQPKWDPYYAEVMQYYMLPQVLTNYGKPSEVILLTYRNDRQRPDVTSFPFFLVLLYPEQGFYMKYEMERVSTGAEFLGCPSKSFVDIVVWPPNDNEVYERIVKPTINGEYLSGYKSLGDATSMTIEEFFQVFSNPNNQECLKTPIETWPNP